MADDLRIINCIFLTSLFWKWIPISRLKMSVNKLVLKGTGKMSLHERFTQLSSQIVKQEIKPQPQFTRQSQISRQTSHRFIYKSFKEKSRRNIFQYESAVVRVFKSVYLLKVYLCIQCKSLQYFSRKLLRSLKILNYSSRAIFIFCHMKKIKIKQKFSFLWY